MTACPLCRRPADDRHTACLRAVDDRLTQIPGLYRLLGVILEPGMAPGARVAGTPTPHIPARIEPLSLRGRGGIVAILASWETDWRRERGLAPIPARVDAEHLLAGEHVLDGIITFLRAQLNWAVDHHPAIFEFAGEIRAVAGSCYTAIGASTGAMKIGRCPTVDDDGTPCGRALYADPYGNWVHCDHCDTGWPRHHWAALGRAMHPDNTTEEEAA